MPPKAAGHYCSQCSRTFARSEHLVRHRRTHTKEKPFHCLQCSQSFARSDLLRRHRSKHHCSLNDSSFETATAEMQTADPSRAKAMGGIVVDNVTDTTFDADTTPAGFVPMGNYPGGLDTTDKWPVDDLGELDADNAFGAFLSGSNVPDWLLNFSSTDIEFGLNASPLGGQHSTPMASSTEGRQSVLSRPSTPSHGSSSRAGSQRTTARSANPREFTLSSDCLLRLQYDTSQASPALLPSGAVLSRYIRRYFRSFSRHQPFLHEVTWDPECAASSLILAVCANGAAYDLEHATAKVLHEAAVSILSGNERSLPALQTHMLCIAFAAWEGSNESIILASKLTATMIPELRRHWATRRVNHGSFPHQWVRWIADESLKRIICCLFTLNTLMSLAYELSPAITLTPSLELPAHEGEWYAKSEEIWHQSTILFASQQCQTFESVEMVLADASLPLPANVGVFGCHMAIIAILNRILLLRRSMAPSDSMFGRHQADMTTRLKRWQRMWEAEPEASLSPDNPRGPITFNATALLRVAYVRLVADFSDIRSAFTFCQRPKEIEAYVHAMIVPERDEYATRAALQASLALRIPVKLGIKVVSRTSFWIWSVQHALCYFECAIFLSKWLEAVQGVLDLDADENTVIKVVEEILRDVRGGTQSAIESPCYSELLHSWATLLNTGDTTVWQIIPKMAKVLELYAWRKSNPSE